MAPTSEVSADPARDRRSRWLAAGAIAAVVVLPWWLAQAQAYVGHARSFILAVDWRGFVYMTTLDNPYAFPHWRWSPAAAWLMNLLFVPLGFYVWSALHLVVLAFLRRWWLILIVLLAPPFWDDIIKGNNMTFVAVAGALAMRGSRHGIIASFLLALLTPRPVVAPLIAYLLWTEPWSRRWFAYLFLGHALLVLASGHAVDYVARLIETGPSEMARAELPDWPPRDFFGSWWLLIGSVLAVILTRLRLPGLAGVALTPYWIGNYGLILLVDLSARIGRTTRSFCPTGM